MKHLLAITSATGTAFKRTIPALENSNLVSVRAVQSRSSQKLDAMLSKWPELSTFSSIDEMLKIDGLDIVFIASPPFLHKEQIHAVAKYKKPIICEKPLATTLADAIQIKEIIEESGISFMLAHHIRHQPAISVIKKYLTEQTIGPERFSIFQWNFPVSMQAPSSEWKFDILNGLHHAFYDAGVHAIDLALFFWGMPLTVYAVGEKHLEKDMYDTVTCTLKYQKHTVILHSSLAQTTLSNDLQIQCEKGVIKASGALSEKSIRAITVTTPDRQLLHDFDEINLYCKEVEDFSVSLKDNLPQNGTSLIEAVDAMIILDSIKKSLQSKQPVSLNSSEIVNDAWI